MIVHVVDDDGHIVERYPSNIKLDVDPKYIITKKWEDVIFRPRFDWDLNDWVEGLTPAEVVVRKEKALNQAQVPTLESLIEENKNLKEESKMNAIAIMELAQMVLGR